MLESAYFIDAFINMLKELKKTISGVKEKYDCSGLSKALLVEKHKLYIIKENFRI